MSLRKEIPQGGNHTERINIRRRDKYGNRRKKKRRFYRDGTTLGG